MKNITKLSNAVAQRGTRTADLLDELLEVAQPQMLPPRYLPQLLSVKDVLATLGIGRTRFYELLAEGTLRSVKIGRRTMVLASELEAFIANLPRGGAR